jgi:hypothetical protein
MKRSLPLILAITAYVVAVIVWLAADRRIPRQAFDDFSAENTSDQGLSLARAYLASSGRRVTLLERPIDVRYLPRNGVVFRVGSLTSFLDLVRELEKEQESDPKDKKTAKKPPPRNEQERLKLQSGREHATPILDGEEDEWVRGGGRLVLATLHSYGGLDVRGASRARATKVFPLWRGIESLDEPAPRVLAGDPVLRAAHALYTIDAAPTIARIPVGAGDVILIAAPELFVNQFIGRNLPLLMALAGEKRPVLFDEVVHGQRADDGALAIMKDWNLGPFLLLGLLAFALALWRNGVAVGPREDAFRDTRSEAVDLVDSLGALYVQSMTNGDAILLYYQSLTRTVAAQSGLRGEPLHRRVDDMTSHVRVPGKGEKLDDETFHRSMTRINEAFARIEKQ